MNKFIPPPWWLSKYGISNCDRPIYQIRDRSRGVLAISTGRNHLSDEEDLANLILMAAAPELKAAAQAAIDALTPPRNATETAALELLQKAVLKSETVDITSADTINRPPP